MMIKTTLITKTETGWQVSFFENDCSQISIFDTEQAARLAAYHFMTDYEDHLTFED